MNNQSHTANILHDIKALIENRQDIAIQVNNALNVYHNPLISNEDKIESIIDCIIKIQCINGNTL